MPAIFFGPKLSGLCIVLGLQPEAPSEPPPPHHVYFEYPPGDFSTCVSCENHRPVPPSKNFTCNLLMLSDPFVLICYVWL